MSLKKKLTKEIEELNIYVIIRNTDIFHLYEIYDYESKNKIYFYYSKFKSYKDNIKMFKYILLEFYKNLGKLEIIKCYEGKKYLNYNEYEDCKKYCYYHNICKSKEIEV